MLTEVADLTSDTAAITLMMTKSSYETIQLLKCGCEIIAASLNELCVNVLDLQQKHSQLTQDYISLQDQLDLLTEVTHQVDQRHNTGQKLKQMIEDI